MLSSDFRTNPLTAEPIEGQHWGQALLHSGSCPQMPLSDVQIRSLKPIARMKRHSDAKGLYLEVSPQGGKWWRLKYRFEGREKRISLGTYPEVSLRDARSKCEDARRLLAAGVDPSVERKAKRVARASAAKNTFEMTSREWIASRSKNWVPAHAERVTRLFERDLFPRLGKRPIAEITAPELLAVVRTIEERVRETAGRALGSCGQVFRFGMATGRCVADPTLALRGALPTIQSKHFAATTEPKRLGGILRAMDGYAGTPSVCAALRLGPLVFVRPGELRREEWAHISLELGEWHFTSSKTKQEHLVPLSTQAVAILLDLFPVTGEGRYVFPSARDSRRPMSDNAVLAAMRRMGVEKDEMCGHGFRAVARTVLDETLGYRPDFIEHQLAHAVRDPNGRAYNRTKHLAERRKMMQGWADYLDVIKAA